MSRGIRLVLLTSLPAIAGCGGCPGQRAQTDEFEERIESPPLGTEQVLGAPFSAWWQQAHPPIVVRKTVQRGTSHSSGGSRVFYRPYYGGRSGFLSSGSSFSGSGTSHSSGGVSRGGFGGIGHSSSGS